MLKVHEGQYAGVEKFPHTLQVPHYQLLNTIQPYGNGAAELSKLLLIPSASTYRYLTHLIQRGFVEKIGCLFSKTTKGDSWLSSFKRRDYAGNVLRRKSDDRFLRFHSLQGKFNVVSPPKNYDKLLMKYCSFPVGRSKIPNGFKFSENNAIIVFSSPTSITVTFPDVPVPYTSDTDGHEGFVKIGEMIDALGYRLQKIFPGLEINWFKPFNLNRMHIALRNSKFVKKYFELHRIRFSEGNIISDKSGGAWELETESLETAGTDVERIIELEREHDKSEEVKDDK